MTVCRKSRLYYVLESKKSIYPFSSTYCSPGSQGSTNCPVQQHTQRSDQHCFMSELWSKMSEMAPLGVILHKMSRPGMDTTPHSSQQPHGGWGQHGRSRCQKELRILTQQIDYRQE